MDFMNMKAWNDSSLGSYFLTGFRSIQSHAHGCDDTGGDLIGMQSVAPGRRDVHGIPSSFFPSRHLLKKRLSERGDRAAFCQSAGVVDGKPSGRSKQGMGGDND